MNNPEKEKYSANEAQNQRVPVVVWPRAWRRRKKSGKRTENGVPGGGKSARKRARCGKELGDSKGKLSQFRAKGLRRQGCQAWNPSHPSSSPVSLITSRETSRRDSVPPFSYLQNGNIESVNLMGLSQRSLVS